MSHSAPASLHAEATHHAEVRLSRAWAYVAVFVVVNLAMLAALWAAHAASALGVTAAWSVISALALFSLAAQLFGLLEIGSRPRRWHALVLVMTLPLFVLTIGLTLLMFHGLMLRTMLMH